jgi:hypothetical protein
MRKMTIFNQVGYFRARTVIGNDDLEVRKSLPAQTLQKLSEIVLLVCWNKRNY